MYNSIEIHRRGLQEFGMNAKSKGSFLVPVLLSKVPDDIRFVVSRPTKGENWKLDNLIEILTIDVEVNIVHVDHPVAKLGVTASSQKFFQQQKIYIKRKVSRLGKCFIYFQCFEIHSILSLL